MVMDGVTGMEMHPLGAHSTDIIASKLGVSEHPGPENATHKSVMDEHHAEDSSHGASQDCICSGVCEAEGTSKLYKVRIVSLLGVNLECPWVKSATTCLIGPNSTSDHLLPFPNAPPLRT